MSNNKYFNVRLEFNKESVDNIIEYTITHNGKGYVCSVERTVMATANKDTMYRDIINNALVNICDGSFVAKTIGWAHKKKYHAYVGADLFINYIKKRKYKQYFLGNTDEILDGLNNNLCKYDERIKEMQFVSLPFRPVDEFDYVEIARHINMHSPDIVWVSLGAPKQEVFMSKLLPYINRGVLFGFGAIFNFYSDLPGQNRAPRIFLKLKLEWFYRIYQEPIKNISRNWEYLKIVPRLIKEERVKLVERQ